MNGMKPTWQHVAIFAALCGTVAFLAWQKVELTTFLGFAGLVVTGLVGTQVLASRAEQQAEQQATRIEQQATREVVADVKTQANGNTQKLVDALLARDATRDAQMAALLAQLPPAIAAPALDATLEFPRPISPAGGYSNRGPLT